VQGANDSNSAEARTNIETEITSLGEELTRIADSTNFNGTKLLDGSNTSLAFQVGADGDTNSTITVTLDDVKSTVEDIGALKVTNNTTAQASITAVDTAIEAISTTRAGLGAMQNRLEHTIKNVNVAVENLSASESRIRDTDMAQEMVSFTRAQILSQAGTAMLAQANQIPQGVLSLLR
jgi:flagellin